MEKRSVFVIMIAVATGAACSNDPVELDCASYCNVVRCSANTETRDRPTMTECLAECVCMETTLSGDIKSSINECGDESTCDEVTSCWFDALFDKIFDDLRPIEKSYQSACFENDGRCGSSGYDCDDALLISEDKLEQRIDCFRLPCSDVSACLDSVEGAVCQ